MYRGMSPSYTSRVYYNGGYVPSYGYGFWGGYALASWSNPWYHYMPFHPAFWYGQPYYYGGAVYPGEFSIMRFMISAIIICFVLWLIVRLFRGIGGGGGGGRNVKYTNYR